MTTQLTTTQQRMGEFRKALELTYGEQIKASLPSPRDFNRFCQAMLTCAGVNPKLLETTLESRIACAIQCAHLGLFPDTVIGYAYLVPFFNKKKQASECHLIPGYKGLMQLTRRSGEISVIQARAVYKDDEFRVALGTSDHLTHTPGPNYDGDTSLITHVYAIAAYKSGGMQFETMTRERVETYRARSRAGQSGPWVTDWLPMALKTVIKRLIPFLPSATVAIYAAQLDDMDERGVPQNLQSNAVNIIDAVTVPPDNGEQAPADGADN